MTKTITTNYAIIPPSDPTYKRKMRRYDLRVCWQNFKAALWRRWNEQSV